MSKFTKGKWKVEDNLLVNEIGRLIAIIAEIRDEQNEEFQANARLLVEAKNMYKLLHKVLKRMNDANKVFRRSFYVETIAWIDENLCRDEIEALLKEIDGEQEAQS